MDANSGDRCPPQRNEIIRCLCAQEDAILVDLERVFIRIAPHGLVGKELMFDNCHWWVKYDSLVSEEIVQSIIEYYKTHLKSPLGYLDKREYSSVSKIQELLTTTPIDLRNRAIEIMLTIITRIIYLHYEFGIGFLDERVISFFKIAYQLDPELFDNSFLLKKRLFEKMPTNWWSQETISYVDKNWSIVLCHIGEAFRRLGVHLKAIEYFNEAIKLSPDFCFSYLGRSLVYYERGQRDKAKRDFKEITERHCQHPLVDFYRESMGF